MKAILLLFFSLSIYGQNFDMTEEMNTFIHQGFSIGNGCDSDVYMYVNYDGDFDMYGGTIEIMKSHITVQGILINEGTFLYRCDDSVLEVLGSTLSTPANDLVWLKVFPNPVIDEINIIGINVTSLKLYTVYGQIIKEYKTFGQSHKIMVNDLSSGIYYLRINEVKTVKIIKK